MVNRFLPLIGDGDVLILVHLHAVLASGKLRQKDVHGRSLVSGVFLFDGKGHIVQHAAFVHLGRFVQVVVLFRDVQVRR